jgi:beta-galactosidase
VLDWLPLGEGKVVQVRFADGRIATGEVWSELIEAKGAETVATFLAPFLSGHPAITLNKFGVGTAQYIGTQLDRPALAQLLKAAWTRAGVEPVSEVPVGIEAVRRTVADGSLLFLLNHTDASVDVTLPGHAVHLNAGNAETNGRVHLEPRDVAILLQSGVPAPT